MRTPYTREKLTQDFANLGIEKGDTLFIHSSFKSLGTRCGWSRHGHRCIRKNRRTRRADSNADLQSLTESGRTRRIVECCDNTFNSRMADRILSPDARHLSLRPLFARRCCTREKRRSVCGRSPPTRGVSIAVGPSIRGARLTVHTHRCFGHTNQMPNFS